MAPEKVEKKGAKKSWGSRKGKLVSLGKGHGSGTQGFMVGDGKDKVGRVLLVVWQKGRSEWVAVS